MSNQLLELEELGYISRNHGIHGEMIVITITPIHTPLEKVDFLFIELQGKPVPFPVEKIQKQSNNALLIQLDFIKDELHARNFRKCRVFIAKMPENPQSKPEIHKYAGYTLKDEDSNFTGQVKSMMEIPGNPLLIVKVADKEILVPLEASYIIDIDEQNRQIRAKLPEGLTEL